MTDVPSNLIPTRISQLPEYTGSSQEGYLPYVYEGVTYKVRFSGVASAGEVPPSRTLTAGTGLTGGGDLSADRVFAISDGGVGADQLDATGVVAGVYGDASNIPTITVDANGRVSDVTTSPIVALGYVPESRVITAGDGLSGGGNLAGDRSFSVNFSSVAPSPLGSASAGVANVAAREDHVHPAVDLSDMTETQGTLPLGRGGTGASLSPIAGAVAYSNGTHMSLTPVGVVGQVLVSGGVNAPSWVTLTGTGTVTSVNIDGATSGLNFIGGPITTAGVFTLQDPGFIQFDTAYGASRNTGRLWWNDDDNAKTFMVGGEGSDVDIKLGEQNYFRIKASAAITKGQVVMFTGTVGASGGLQGAPATGLTKATASYIMGVAAEDIALNGWGYITEFGLIRQLDTTAFSDGDILYYDPDVVGGLRVGAPPAPAAKAELAAVVLSASNGSIFVRATHQFELEQLNDVETAAASDLDLLEYNGSSGVWRHRDPQLINVGGATNVLGGAANQIVYQTGSDSSSFIAAPTSANTFLEWSGSAFQWSANPLGTVTSVDVSGGTTGLTASGGPVTSSGTITLGGTLAVANGGTGATDAATALTNLGAYPASNPDGYTTNTGTVTSVAATAGTGISVSGSPITTSGTLTITNTAPDQTVTLTQGGTTTITGTYPNFTISSADQYDGTVTSVAATVPTGFTVSGSPITTSGTLAIGFDTGYSLPTDAEQANWDTAYTDRYKWDGGSSGLVAATGRTSLGLGTSAVLDAGVAGGVATLDGGGTVPTSQLPSAVIGAVSYQGTWNASTNTPTLTSSTGTQGYYYVVSVAGTTTLDGISDWGVGDWAIFNGSTWDKIDNTDAVTSVNGYTGTVVLDYSDVGAYADTNPAGYTTNTGTVTSVAATAGTGISVSGSPITTSGTLTITNTAPDQTVTLTQAGTTTITGTYPNFTISSADQYDGTVTSVSGTGTVNGLTLSGTVTSSGSLTLGGTLSGIDLTSQITGTLPVANGGTGATSLTSGYVLKGNGTSPVSASVIYDNGTNVGIGTTSPSYPLDIEASTATVGINMTNTANRAEINLQESGTTKGILQYRGSTNGTLPSTMRIGTQGSDDLIFNTAGAERLRVLGTGSIGIGTTSPDSKLDIEAANSQLRLTDSDDSKFVEFSYSGGKLITRNNSTSTTVNQFTLDESGRLGIGTTSPSQTLQVQGIGYATGSFRAPVFYDSDDTAYFLNPTGGGSTINGMISTGRIDMQSTDGYQLESGKHRITYNDGGGNFNIRVGHKYDSGNVSTETGYAGWIEYTQSNGQWEFWTTDASYTAGTTGITFNKGFAITPLNTYLYYNNGTRLTTTNAGITVTGSGTATTDFRAPRFYDSDNTAYYVDPASTSALNGLTSYGDLIISKADARLKLYDSTGTSGNNPYVEWETTANQGIAMELNVYDGELPVSGYGLVVREGPSNGQFPTTGTLTFNVLGEMYAGGTTLSSLNKVFHDGYHPNADTLTTARTISLTGDATGSVSFNGSANVSISTTVVDDSHGHSFNNLLNKTGGTGTYQTSGSFRAPIFYDSNNTGYYIHGDSTSNLNALTLASNLTVNNGNIYGPTYINMRYGSSGAGAIRLYDSDGAVQSYWYGDGSGRGGLLDNNGHWAVKVGIGTEGLRLYCDNNEEFIVNTNHTLSTGSSRAPIFYDSNNTNFYINPNGTSNCNDIKAENLPYAKAGSAYGTENTFTTDGGVGANNITRSMFYRDNNGQFGALGVSITHATSPAYTLQIASESYSASSNNLMYRVQNNGTWTSAVKLLDTGSTTQTKSGVLQSSASLRAPIFYDSNNTSYYLNPASESVLNTVTFFGELNLSAATTYVDHTGTITFRNQSGYATSATLTTSGNFTATGNVTAYSDIRVKDNVEQIGGALERLQAIRGVTYTRNDLDDKERRYAGVIAQEIEEVLPEAVFDNGDRKAVDYNATIGLLIEAIKELKAEVETLKKG